MVAAAELSLLHTPAPSLLCLSLAMTVLGTSPRTGGLTHVCMACLATHFLPSLGLCSSEGGHQCIYSAVLQLLAPGPWPLAPLLLLGPWEDPRQIYTNHPAPGFLTVTLSQTLPGFLWPLSKEQPTPTPLLSHD